MNYAEVTESAFLDELQKIDAAKGQLLRTAKTRAVRRPMRVATMLRKDKAGELYKFTGPKVGADESP